MRNRDVLGQIRDLQAHMAAMRGQRPDGLFAQMADQFAALTEEPGFLDLGRPVHDPMIAALLARVAGTLCRKPALLAIHLMIQVDAAGFIHGFAVVDEWMVMFFWFTETREGLAVFSGQDGVDRLIRMSEVDAEDARHPAFGAGPAIPGEH